MNIRQQRVIVVGGGLAGMACAAALAQRGLAVTLLEARQSLGGRAGSFEDHERPGAQLDNCQHMLLGCCTNLLDLYRRLGVLDRIGFHRRVHFMDGQGRRHALWSVRGIPAPLHLGPAMALFGALSVAQRVIVVRAMLAMARLGREGRQKLEGVPFGAWLDQHRQPDALVRRFYDPIVVSALNEETRRASAKYAIQVFQEAMLAHNRGCLVGLSTCPLGHLYERLPQGVDVRTGARVEDVMFQEDQGHRAGDGHGGWRAVAVRVRGGEELTGDAVVLATNHHAVRRWVGRLPEAVRMADGRFEGLDRFESVPILGAHLWFDRPVMRQHAMVLLSGPLEWLFRKDETGRAVHGVISAARNWVQVAKEDALRQFEAQIRELFVPAREARLLRGMIVIEKRATFAPLPGVDTLRPAQAPPPGGVARLFLAGDYTRTQWPATMEGAVRGGYLAAEAVLADLGGQGPRVVVEDIPRQWPARLLGL